MNKDIKILIESFFDDMFDDNIKNSDNILPDNESTNDTILKTLYEPLLLTKCKSKEDIITCYKENSPFIQWYEKNIDDIISYLKHEEELLLYVSNNINDVMINYFNDGSISLSKNELYIEELDKFGLCNDYTFYIDRSCNGKYHVFLLYLNVTRSINNYIDKSIYVTALYVTDMDCNIITDKNILKAYSKDFSVLSGEEIIKTILPNSFYNNCLDELSHEPVIFPVTKRDISLMQKDRALYDLSKYNCAYQVIPKVIAYYCILYKLQDLFVYNTTNIAKWVLYTHEVQRNFNVTFSTFLNNIYLSDIVASIKNYIDNNKNE